MFVPCFLLLCFCKRIRELHFLYCQVNFAENFKRSTSRDFRINTETVHTAVEQGISDDSETEENNSKEPEENEVQVSSCLK